jgi:condensin complex subunit 1
MDSVTDFNINDALRLYLSDPATILTPEAEGALQDCENDPESLSPAVINSVLNPIVEAIAENPEALGRSAIFDSLQFLLKCEPISLNPLQRFPNEPDSELFKLSRYSSFLPNVALSKILDVLVSALSAEADAVHSDLESDEQDAVQHHKKMLEMYGFLLQWTISVIETKAAEKSATAAPVRARGGKGAKAKAGAKDGVWDSAQQLTVALDVMCKVLKLKLGRIFLTTSDRDTMVGLFTRSVYLIFESEQRTKNTAIKMHAFKVLCIAVKHHGHAFGIFRVALERSR